MRSEFGNRLTAVAHVWESEPEGDCKVGPEDPEIDMDKGTTLREEHDGVTERHQSGARQGDFGA
jgi:hypothetical protein